MGDVCSYVCVHLCVFICLPVYVFIYVSVCFYVCMCVEHMSVSAVVCVCMCPCACVGASFGVALRGGGLPVHGYLPQVGLGHWYPLEIPLMVGVVHPTKHQQAALLRPAEERRKKELAGGE